MEGVSNQPSTFPDSQRAQQIRDHPGKLVSYRLALEGARDQFLLKSNLSSHAITACILLFHRSQNLLKARGLLQTAAPRAGAGTGFPTPPSLKGLRAASPGTRLPLPTSASEWTFYKRSRNTISCCKHQSPKQLARGF